MAAHGESAVDLSRAKRGLSFLVEHDGKDLVGLIEKIRIDADKKMRGTVRFSENPRAKEIKRDIEDGIRGISDNPQSQYHLDRSKTYFGDANLLAAEAGRYLAVTADDVKKAVADHLTLTRRTVVETYPQDEPKPAKAHKKPSGAGDIAAHDPGSAKPHDPTAAKKGARTAYR